MSLYLCLADSLTEALVVLLALVSQNVEIQKILAFAGAFDGLLAIINGEGGIEGGVTVQDSLLVLEQLLRLNVSNQV
jgi:intracellular protein transport protein USO1